MNIEGPQHIYVRTTVYNKTDFEEMLLMSDYKKALFIFNDNDVDIGTDVSGNDSAKIRVYNTYSKKQIPYPRSAGIPVGYFFEKNGSIRKKRSLKSKIDEREKENQNNETVLECINDIVV